MEKRLIEIETKVSELYAIVKRLDEYLVSQTEVNAEISNLLKPAILKISSLDQEVGFLNDNLISTIKNNNTMHDALNKSIESITRMLNSKHL